MARAGIPLAVVLPLTLLCACDQGDRGPQDKSTQSLVMPLALRTSTLPDNSRLRAFLDVNGTRQAMMINGNSAEARIPHLSPGSSSVSIAFEYESPDFGNRVLAMATRTLVLQPGENTLSFSDQDYQFPDDDNDSHTNLAEIRNSTNPNDRADPPKQWGEARRVSLANIDTTAARLAVSAGGNALALWSQRTGEVADGSDRYTVWANHFDAARGWAIAESISSAEENRPANRGIVEMDALGNGLAVWYQGENVWINHFDAAVGWGGPAVRAQTPTLPTLATNGRGDAAAVWIQDAPGQMTRVAWANRFLASTGGGSPTRISDNIGQVEALSPQAVVDPNGNALAIWRQRIPGMDGAPDGPADLWASRYVADTGWGSPLQIENAPEGSRTHNPAIDGEGNALVVWVHGGASNVSVMAARYNAITDTWDNAEPISDVGDFNPGIPVVDANARGEALAVWIQLEETGQGTVYANRFDSVSGWAEASPIVADQFGLAQPPAAAIGDGGEALAAWIQHDNTQNYVWTSRFDPNTGWGLPTLAGFSNTGTLGFVQVGVDDNGRGLAVWDSGGTAIWSNRLQ